MQSTGTHSNRACLSSPISLYHPISPGTHLLLSWLPPLPSSVVSDSLIPISSAGRTRSPQHYNTAESSSALEWCFWCSVSACVCVCVCVVGMFWMVSCKCVKSSVKLYSVCIRARERGCGQQEQNLSVNLIKSLRRGLFPARYCVYVCVFVRV